MAAKAAKALPVVLVSRLTICVARESLRTETDASESSQRQTFLKMRSMYVAVSIRWSCGWTSLHTKAQRLLEQLS